MATGYYLLDHPNPYLQQYGWLRSKVSGAIGIHTTESITDYEGVDPNAENTWAFISRRTDYGSYHVIADFDSIVKGIGPEWAAWADTTNNIHAMSVSGALQASTWSALAPERARKIVSNMAKAAYQLASEAVRKGLLAELPPARRITASEAIAGTKAGFYGHGETNPLTRTDPGKSFDWDYFLSEYARFRSGGVGIDVAGNTEDWLENMDKAELVKLLDERIDAGIQRLLRYDGTTRTDRPLYALQIDAGLNATDAKEYARQAVEIGNRILLALEALPREVLAYKGKDETVDVYQKLNDSVAVLVAGVDPSLTATAQKSGAVKATLARAAAITKTEPIEG